MDNIASSSARPATAEIEPVSHKGHDKQGHVSTTAVPDEAGPGPSDAEAGSVKAYYSKTSVWLMVLYSGLAIGSDGLYVLSPSTHPEDLQPRSPWAHH